EFFLSDVGRIADDRGQCRQRYWRVVGRQFAERLLGVDVEEIAAGNARVVGLAVNFARCDVESCEVSGIERNVGAEQLRNQFKVRLLGFERTLSVVGANKEAAAAAGGIEHGAICGADAKGVYEIDHIVAGEVLAPTMAFFGADETLKDAAHDVGGYLAEVVMLDPDQRSLPRGESAKALEDQTAGPILLVGKQDGLVVAANARGIIEHPLEIGVGVSGRFDPAKTKLGEL